MSEVMSQVLDYSRMKKRAASSVAERVILASSNGNSFTCSQVAEIQIPGNQMSTFMDWQSSYLKFTINNNDGDAIVVPGTGGAYNLIKKIEVLSSGQTLVSIDNYNKLVCALSDMQHDINYRDNNGSLLAGMNSDGYAGTSIAAAGKKTFCLPLAALPMTGASKYWPLFSRDSLRVRISFDSAVNAFISAAAADPLDSEVVINPIELVALNVKLNETAMMALNQAVGGVYTIVSSDYRNATESISATQTSAIANVAFSFTSLDRVIFGFYPDQGILDADTNAGRQFHNMEQYSFKVNGKNFPQRVINCSETNLSEPVAELLNSSNALVDLHHVGGLNRDGKYFVDGPTNSSNATTCHALFGINLEQVREHGVESLYSGVSTLGSVTQLDVKFSAVEAAADLQAWAQYTATYQLDTNANNTWVMAQ